ncbi:6946_t:CDS:2, partial [Cetraspora pellucida]
TIDIDDEYKERNNEHKTIYSINNNLKNFPNLYILITEEPSSAIKEK